MRRSALVWAVVLALLSIGLTKVGSSHAANLAEIYLKARAFEPGFQSAIYEKTANDMDVTIARSAYYPTAALSIGRPAGADAVERSVSVRQPIIDLAAYTRLQKAKPSEVIAQATFLQREQELAGRVFAAVAQLIRLNELVRLSQRQVSALTQQVTRAQQSFERGRGTITEVRNTEVRLAQARGNAELLAVQRTVAQRQYEALVGEAPPAQGFTVSYAPRPIRIIASSQAVARALSASPQSQLAQQRKVLAELTLRERTSDFIPNVSWVAEQRWREGVKSELFTGVNISVPFGLSVANVLGRRKAALQVDQAREVLRDSEQKTRLQVEALHAYIQSGEEELRIRLSAIEAAELSADANVQSFDAGIVSSIEVINALLAVFEVRRDYLVALLETGRQLLEFELSSAVPPAEALQTVGALVLSASPLLGQTSPSPSSPVVSRRAYAD